MIVGDGRGAAGLEGEGGDGGGELDGCWGGPGNDGLRSIEGGSPVKTLLTDGVDKRETEEGRGEEKEVSMRPP